MASPISNNDSMFIEEPVKKTRSRASTVGFNSPPSKSELSKINQLTSDTFNSLSKYYDNGKSNDEIYFDGAHEKIKNLQFGRFLDAHGVQEKFRAKMIDWIFEVLTIYQQRDSTIFKSIFIMDLFYTNSKQKIPIEELHLIGIVCMMIASKSEEVKYIRLDAFINVIGRGKFTKEQILAKEVEILNSIGFRTSYSTIYELMRCAFRLIDVKNSRVFFERSALLLAKMCLCSYELVSGLSIKEIALCCIIIALKLTEKLGEINSTISIKKALEIFEMPEDRVILKKVQLIHSFAIEFGNIMPYVKNIENFNDFANKDI